MYVLFYSFDEVSCTPNTPIVEETKPAIDSEYMLKPDVFKTHVPEQSTDNPELEKPCTRAAFIEPKCEEVTVQQKSVPTTEVPTVKLVQPEREHCEDVSKIKTSNAQCESRQDKPVIQTYTNVNEKIKRYSYSGPPKISLSTWNERPKRQVSIKTDRDYVIGIRQRLQRTTETEVKSKDEEIKPVSRVPIVKSVELKKPYAEQLQTASPVLPLSEVIKAQAKLSNGYHSSRAALTKRDESKIASNKNEHENSSYTFRKLITRPRKPREISANVDPRETLLESIRSFGGRDNLRKIRA